MTSAAGVLDLDDPAARDPAIAGRKAATLARLRRDGYRVPHGVVLPAGLVDDVRRAGAGALPASTRTELEAALRACAGCVAVRSSGIAEDLDDASWAGQYDTVLHVRTPAALWEAVEACARGASTAQVRAYAASRGDASAPSPVAVLVQRQVEADCAGIAFTANPVTGDDEVLVSAVRGLGDRLAAGAVTPEDWVVRGDAAPERTDGPRHVLDARAADRIARAALRVAASLGEDAVDVEWAVDGAGDLHVLQARPITALPVAPAFDVPAGGTWEKDTSHFAEPATPLCATTSLAWFGAALTEMASTYGLLIDGAEVRSFGGEAYTRIIPPGDASGPPPPWWLLGVLVRVVPPLRAKLRTARAVLAGDLPGRMLERWPSELRPELAARIDALRAVDLRSLDDARLRAHLDRACELSADGVRIHCLLFVPYLMALHELVTRARGLAGWAEHEAFELVGGLSRMTSAPARGLAAIAAAARKDAHVREILAEWSDQPLSDVLTALRAAGGAAVADGIDAHLDRFGCCVTGYDPGRPSVAERPGLLLGILRTLVCADVDPGAFDAGLARRRADADARLAAALDVRAASRADREALLDAVARARTAWPVREDNIYFTDSMPAGLLRLTALEIGRRLVERGALRAAEDACWLERGELRAALDPRDADPGSPREAVARRRTEHAWTAAHPGPLHLGQAPHAPPDLRAAPQAVRRTTGAMLWAVAREYPGIRSGNDDGAEGLRGTPGAPGRYTGPVRIVRGDAEFERVQAGDVLVCPITTPVWSMLFARVRALVTDAGGVLSHAAILAREHDVPAVLGTGDATSRLRDGQTVTVDGTAGIVSA